MGARETSLAMPSWCSSMGSDYSFVHWVFCCSTGNTVRYGSRLPWLFHSRSLLPEWDASQTGRAQRLNIGDGFAGTRCRIQKSEHAVSLGCTAISDQVNSLSHGEGFTLLDRTFLIPLMISAIRSKTNI